MAGIDDLTPDELEELAAERRREAAPARRAPRIPPTCEVAGHEFHIRPDLADDWDFVTLAGEFDAAAASGEAAAVNEQARRVVAYAYVEPYEEIMETLRGAHPEDERPHVHVEDVSALVGGIVPKDS